MSLEEEINYLTAAIQSLETMVSTLTTAMQTLTATATVEIEARTDRPAIEVIKTDDARYSDEMVEARFSYEGGTPPAKRKTRPYTLRKKRAKETVPRQVCRSSCCGAEGFRYSKKKRGCGGCR